MFKQIWRFRASVLPGIGISLMLLSLLFLLFSSMYLAEGADALSSIDSRIIGLLKFTIYQATLSTILSIAVGLLLSWSLAHQPRFFGRSYLVALFSSSLVLPTLIVAFGLISVLGNNGWLNRLSLFLFDHSFGGFLYGMCGILIAHVYLNASFASRTLLHSLESIPVQKYKLAKSLDFTVWQRFWFIEWVAIKSSLLGIASTIFLLCFSSFAIVLMLGGSPSYNTLEVAIYEAVKIDFDIPFALKLALIQLSISSILVILSSNLRTAVSNIKVDFVSVPWRESRWVHIFQVTVISVLAFAFVLPMLAIAVDGVGADYGRILSAPLFQRSFFTSISLATASATITVLFALLLSDARRSFALVYRIPGSKWGRAISIIIALSSNIYLAVPSMILGLGFFLLSQRYEAPFVVWALLAILTANVLMSLPFAMSVIAPAMQRTAQRYDRLSLSLGLSTVYRWMHCELPYLRSSIGYIFALSFSLSLGDLGVVALFGNNEISTLPWYLYQLMGSYKNEDASGVAFILLVLTLGVFVYLPKLFRGR